jgi:hypothetical protein
METFMSNGIPYGNFRISPCSYKRDPGGYVVKGYIYDFQKNPVEITPYFDLEKEYATKEEADAIFIEFAKHHIDNL